MSGGYDPDRIAKTLARYPDVSRAEARDIMSFLQGGSYVDVGRLAGNAATRRKLDEFLKDHWAQFHVPPVGKSPSFAYLAAPLLVAAIIWATLF